MKVLLLSENFHPTNSSGGRLLTDLATDLVERGVGVEVLTSFSSYHVQGEGGRVPGRERYLGVDIRRLPSTRLPRERLLFRLVNEITLCLAIVAVALGRSGVDALMVTSSPPFLAPFAALVARLRRIPLVYVLMDVYPDIAIATGHLRRESLAYRAWDRVTGFALGSATRIVVLGRCMRRVVRGKLDGRDVPIDVVHNWADRRKLHPIPDDGNRFLERYPELRGRFVVQYSGNLGRFHDFETILQAAERLADLDRVRVVIIGDGARREWIAEQIERRGLGNVVLLPFQPQSELIHSLNAQSVSLVTLEAGAEGLCVPSKLYPVLAVAKPVIAVMDENAEVALTVREAGIGAVVAQGDAAGLERAVRELEADPARLAELGERAEALFLSRFDRHHAVAHYVEVLRRAVAPAGAAPAEVR